MAQPSLLRPITQRLVSTPVQQLPQIAPFLASSISACGQVLRAPSESRGDENAVLVHKLKTRLSSLLQDRSPEGRFAAVVLIKATVEAGGVEILATSEPWIRGLIQVLNKQDPVSVKKLCVLTITRVFSLTQAHPSLLREITTPLLPSFITTCLSIIRPKIVTEQDSTSTLLSPLLLPVLRCWLHLLPQNPTTFRPFIPRIQSICLSLIADYLAPDAVSQTASQLLASLHQCAPKNGSSTQWIQICQEVISATHRTGDVVFQAVIEDWVSSQPSDGGVDGSVDGYGILKLPRWSGIHDGAVRLRALLNLLTNLLSCQTTQPVAIPLGAILDLASRLTSITNSSGKASQYSMRHNQEIGRDEREQLWIEVPAIHLSCLKLLTTLVTLLGSAIQPVYGVIIEQIAWVFGTNSFDADIRIAIYRLVGVILPKIGSSLSRDALKPMSDLLRSCCEDQLPQQHETTGGKDAFKSASTRRQPNGLHSTSADSFLSVEQKTRTVSADEMSRNVFAAANELLTVILTHVPATVIPLAVRIELDRTAILTRNKKAMLASILNAPPTQIGKAGPASIVPFAVREYNDDVSIEALLRPRMPIVYESTQIVDPTAQSAEDETFDHNIEKEDINGGNHVTELQENAATNGDANSNTWRAMSEQDSSVTGAHLKRAFASMEEVESPARDQNQAIASSGSLTVEESTKKPRREVGSPSSLSQAKLVYLEEPQEEIAEVPPVITSFLEQHDKGPAWERTTMGVPSLQEVAPIQAIGLVEENGDSSDFEIPQIDIEPDTEEDDNMDDV